MIKWYRSLRMTSKIVIPVVAVLIVILGTLTWQIQSRSKAVLEAAAKRELAALAAQNGNLIQGILNTALYDAGTLAGAFQEAMADGNMPSREQVIAMQTGVYKNNDNLFGCGSMWEPNAFDGRDADFRSTPGSTAEGRFMPYSARDAAVSDLGAQVNETYYTVPKSTSKAYFSDPTDFPMHGKTVAMSTASYPVVVDGGFRGVVVVDVALDELDTVISGIKVYETGYTGLFTSDGLVIAHTEKDLVRKNLFELNRFQNPGAARAAFDAGKIYIEEVDTGEDRIFRYYQPIALHGTDQYWYLPVIVPMSEVLAEATSISWMTIGFCLFTLVVLAVVIFLLVRVSVRPINYLAHTAEVIAEGNLDQPIEDSRFGGELKTLSSALKKMIASLVAGISKAESLSAEAHEESRKAHEAMQSAEKAGREAELKTARILEAADRLENVANIVSSASTELSAQIEQADRGAAESAERLTEAVTAMEEMNVAVREVAQNAGAASEISAQTKQEAEEGTVIVGEAVDSIRNVREVSLALKEDMGALGEKARSITQIMAVISDIADQTNLLALNAAIEAARAGDAGRGFAVVADEVRKLAEKTMTSTTDVGNAIREIQTSVDKTIAGVDRAVEMIEQATEQANRSGEALKIIVDKVDHSADQVRAIAAASEEQSASTEQINFSITQVNSVVNQTAQAMQEAARAVSDLALQAQELSVLIGEMKKM